MPEEKPKPDEDVVFLHGPTEDGEGMRVIRSRTGKPLEAGEVRGAKDGKPLMGAELVTLTPRVDAPRLCDVKVVANGKRERPDARAVEHGPAQVATDAYRTSWERIFGARAKKGDVN